MPTAEQYAAEYQASDAECACGCGEMTMVRLGRPNRFVHGHHRRGVRPAERWHVTADGCWGWAGWIEANGYGKGTGPDGRRTWAHRAIYEERVGPIPKGLDLDHLCRNRACVNPAHLEPVTRRENLRRGRRHQ